MKREYIAVIQAGGKGTRMRELTHDEIPKPLLTFNGKPMMEWQIMSLARYGIGEFVIIIGHLGERIRNYFGDGSKWNVKISYVEEKIPLGSAGALYYAKNAIGKRDVIFVFADVMFALDWKRYITFHEKHGGLVTLLAHPNAHPYDSDLLIVDQEDLVTGIDCKTNVRDYNYKNCVNAGISIFKNELLDELRAAEKKDYESELVEPLTAQGKIFAYHTPEYVKDIGTPDRFYKACEEQKNGIWAAKCLARKQKAVFLDRDGLIRAWKGILKGEEDFELIPGVPEAVRKLNESEYLTIVAENQPVTAGGKCSFGEQEHIHKKLETELGKQGAFINDWFFCPYDPQKGYEGEIPELKFDCECRKPETGRFLQAAEKYNIDLSKSWYIGGITMDIPAGLNVGIKTIVVLNKEAGTGNHGRYDRKPTVLADTLADAVDKILASYL